TRISRADLYAIKAYLDTLEPVRQQDKPPDLPWPLTIRSAMSVWNWLYFEAGYYTPDPDKSDEWNRGAYLVRGIGHCGACHSGKNFAGATDQDNPFRGGMAEHVYAPMLTSDQSTGLGDWSKDDIIEYLGTGANDITSAAGPMAEVVHHSTQHLSDADLHAVAVYLKSLPKARSQEDADDTDNDIDEETMTAGKAIYVDTCRSCHMNN